MFYIEVFIVTSIPLALSSLITNSKSVKGLPDFSIASAYVTKTGKCFLSLVENNLFTQSASDSLPVCFFSWYYQTHLLLFGENSFILYSDFADSQHEMKKKNIYKWAAFDLLLRRDIWWMKVQTFVLKIATPITNHYAITFTICLFGWLNSSV